MDSPIFTEYRLGNLTLKNRLVRSATYEGACDENGIPGEKYFNIYKNLARHNIGMIITGFAFVSPRGRAMQKAQAGIDSIEKAAYLKRTTDIVHENNTAIIMQIAHTGRQTLRSVTGSKPLSSSANSSIYFREKPVIADNSEVNQIREEFVISALNAKSAGFDGIQLHAAHGYLLHQFLLPETNKLKTEYGIDKNTGIGTKLLEEIYDEIREKCGDGFLILIKISGSHDLSSDFFPGKFDSLITFIERKKFDAVEISYGTMDYALNIFRGDMNLETVFNNNPIYKTGSRMKKFLTRLFINYFIAPKFHPFTPAYNLIYAGRAKRMTNIPVISVGGFRSKGEIEYALLNNSCDLAGLSRPFICEPDFADKLFDAPENYVSRCMSCNECVFMCDSGKVTACYSNNKLA